MRLLTPQQHKDAGDNQRLREIMRTQELDKASQAARLNLANSQAAFSDSLANQRLKWAKEEDDHAQQVAKQEAELAVLEQRFKLANQPIALLKQEAEAKLAEANFMLKEVLIREEDAELLAEQLQDRLDAVGIREEDVKRREVLAHIKDLDLANQAHNTTVNGQILAQQIHEFNQQCQANLAALDSERQRLLPEQARLSLKAQELDARELELNALATRLSDERGTIDRIYKLYPHTKPKAKAV